MTTSGGDAAEREHPSRTPGARPHLRPRLPRLRRPAARPRYAIAAPCSSQPARAFGLGRAAGQGRCRCCCLVGRCCVLAALGRGRAIAGAADRSTAAAVHVHDVRGASCRRSSCLFVAAQAPQLVAARPALQVLPLYFCRAARDRSTTSLAEVRRRWPRRCSIVTARPAARALSSARSWRQLDFGRRIDESSASRRSLAVALLSLAVFAGIGLVIASFTPRRGFGIAAIIALFILPSPTAPSPRSSGHRRRRRTAPLFDAHGRSRRSRHRRRSAASPRRQTSSRFPGGVGASSAGAGRTSSSSLADRRRHGLLMRRYRTVGL